MTCTDAGNVFPLAIEGTFDDAQSTVKELFSDLTFRKEVGSPRKFHQLGSYPGSIRLLSFRLVAFGFQGSRKYHFRRPYGKLR